MFSDLWDDPILCSDVFFWFSLQELMENYLFVCRCTKCEDQINDPDVTSDEDEEEMDEDD